MTKLRIRYTQMDGERQIGRFGAVIGIESITVDQVKHHVPADWADVEVVGEVPPDTELVSGQPIVEAAPTAGDDATPSAKRTR